VALWELGAKSAGLPLWAYLGGATSDAVEAYNTDAGWLSIPKAELVTGTRRAVDEGFRFIKLKVGQADPRVDLDRIAAVRDSLGPSIHVFHRKPQGIVPSALKILAFADDDRVKGQFGARLHCLFQRVAQDRGAG